MALISMVTLRIGLTVSFASTGDRPGPALVMLPGPTDSWRSYDMVLADLPVSLRSVAVSQRGHGDTDKPPTGYQVVDFARDVPLLLDALDIDRAVLAGHSGSCLVARRVAIEYPERVAGLFLEASPTTLVGSVALQEFVARLPDQIDRDFARAFVLDTSSGDLSQDVAEGLTDELLKVPAHVWAEMFHALMAYDDRAELQQITAPTLLVWGDADPIVTREMQEELAAEIPVAELVVYRGFGHTPRWEDPGRFARDLATFASHVLRPALW